MDMFTTLAGVACFLGALVAFIALVTRPMWQRKGNNPFPLGVPIPEHIPVEEDQAKRNQILKKLYNKANMSKFGTPDAVIIGSGVGGLTAGAVLSRAGKKVLVLEQHDVAGGCCHTFFQDGYEFDSGIHYIGAVRESPIKSVGNLLMDFQLKWEPMADEYDVALVNGKSYPMKSGLKAYKANLVKMFPGEEKAIEEYVRLVLLCAKESGPATFAAKHLPKWLMSVLISTGLFQKITGDYFRLAGMTVKEVLDSVTSNEELKSVLSYCFGDYGMVPSKGSFAMHAAVVNHYFPGAAYPVGGSSEIAYQLIKQIHKSGGEVMVMAEVAEILTNGNVATGVRMVKEDVVIECPTIISDAGFFNTYRHLCPQLAGELDSAPVRDIKGSISCVSLFVGLNGSTQELGIKAQNHWILPANVEKVVEDFEAMTTEELVENKDEWDLPGVFVSFPSAKDPCVQKRMPTKSTCAVIGLVPYKWFKEWENEKLHNRGTDYLVLKNILADKMWKAVLKVYPNLEGTIDSIDSATPLSVRHYIQQSEGEIYGLDHGVNRFSPRAAVELRPQTPVKGLFLTGQDIVSAGYGGALMGGVFTGGAVLERNVMLDLLAHKNDRAKKVAAEKKDQ